MTSRPASPHVARAITTARKLIAGAHLGKHPAQLRDWVAAVHRPCPKPRPRAARSAPGPRCNVPRPSARCGASFQTLGSRAAAIRFFHRAAGLASPTDQRVVRDLLEGARREDAGRDHDRATVTVKCLAAALTLQGPPATPIAIRDRAILLLTFASGRRRAEIAGLNIEDLDFSRPGFLILTIRKSKTDQGGAGQFVAVPRLERGPCAVTVLEAWLGIREQKKGPLFVAFSPHGELRGTRIDGRLVAEVVKRLFRDAGAAPGDIDTTGRIVCAGAS